MASSNKHSWTFVPEKQENIHTKINTVLKGHKQHRFNRAMKIGLIVAVILVFGLTLAFSKRADFSESFMAEVIDDTDLDALFGGGETTTDEDLFVEDTTEGDELGDIFADDTTTDTTAGDDLEDIFADDTTDTTTGDELDDLFADPTGTVDTTSETDNLEDIFADDTAGDPEDLEDIFSGDQLDTIEAITEARELTGLTPVTFEETPLQPETVTDTDTTTEDLTFPAPSEEEEVLDPVEVEESTESTVVFGEEPAEGEIELPDDAFELPDDDEFSLPDDDEIELPDDDAFTLPDDDFIVADTTDTTDSALPFPVNYHTVSQAPRIGMVALPDQSYYGSATQQPTVAQYPSPQPQMTPQSGPELYAILFLTLLISAGVWRFLSMRKA